jgi:hypothetical protein
MNKVHWIGSQDRYGYQQTACGMQGVRCQGFDTEYDTVEGNRFEANYRDWQGVTCKRCLRNPHAPGGRYATARADSSLSHSTKEN